MDNIKYTLTESQEAFLNLMYTSHKILNQYVVLNELDDVYVLTNYDGEEIRTFDKNTFSAVGNSLFSCKDNKIQAYNCNKFTSEDINLNIINGKHTNFLNSQVSVIIGCKEYPYGIKEIKTDKYYILVNSDNQVILISYSINSTNLRTTGKYLFIPYRQPIGYTWEWRTARFNLETNKIDIYNLQQISHSSEEWQRVSIDLFCNEWKLYNSYDDKIIGKNTYTSIAYVDSYFNCFKSFVVSNDLSLKTNVKGLLSIDGTEIIPVKMDRIEALSDTYIFYEYSRTGLVDRQLQNKKEIYNAKTKSIAVSAKDTKEIYIHQTLPLCIIVYNNDEVKLFDFKGNIFNVADIAKYMKCFYSMQDTKVIKVRLDNEKEVYIDTRLNPITNYYSIKMLNEYQWIPMG